MSNLLLGFEKSIQTGRVQKEETTIEKSSIFALILIFLFIATAIGVTIYMNREKIFPTKVIDKENLTIISPNISDVYLRTLDIDTQKVIENISYTFYNNGTEMKNGTMLTTNEIIENLYSNESYYVIFHSHDYYATQIPCGLNYSNGHLCTAELRKKALTPKISYSEGTITIQSDNYLNEPVLFLSYTTNVYDPYVIGADRCKVPSQLLLKYDRCFKLTSLHDNYSTYVLNYSKRDESLGRMNITLVDLDIDNSFSPTYFNDDVKDVSVAFET